MSYVVNYRNFYNIAHMTNRVSEIDWAITSGANGVEIDLAYEDDGNDGAKPRYGWHGYPCDCSCLGGAEGGMCYRMDSNCDRYEEIDNLLSHVATTDLELVWLDNKVTNDYARENHFVKKKSFLKELTKEKFEEAGTRMAEKVIAKLFDKGYGGKLVVGGPDSMHFLTKAKEKFDQEGYTDRIWYSVDGTDGGDRVGADDAIAKLKVLTTDDKRAYTVGYTACNHKHAYYKDSVKKAKDADIPIISAWTVDRTQQAKDYIDAGATGFITNFPGTIKDVAENKGFLEFDGSTGHR